MCYALYLASDSELPVVSWQEHSPGFNTHSLFKGEQVVTKQFSLPFVRYLGSHQGCSCGFFSYSEVPANEDEVQENAECLKSMADLISYVRSAVLQSSHLEMYLCWEGDQAADVVARHQLSIAAFESSPFPLGEKEFAIINK